MTIVRDEGVAGSNPATPTITWLEIKIAWLNNQNGSANLPLTLRAIGGRACRARRDHLRGRCVGIPIWTTGAHARTCVPRLCFGNMLVVGCKWAGTHDKTKTRAARLEHQDAGTY
jgi:hypothetical protein